MAGEAIFRIIFALLFLAIAAIGEDYRCRVLRDKPVTERSGLDPGSLTQTAL